MPNSGNTINKNIPEQLSRAANILGELIDVLDDDELKRGIYGRITGYHHKLRHQYIMTPLVKSYGNKKEEYFSFLAKEPFATAFKKTNGNRRKGFNRVFYWCNTHNTFFPLYIYEKICKLRKLFVNS